MKDKKDITGIILAGGQSSRMGTDKGLLHFKNKPFILYSIEALTPLVNDIIIVSNNPDYDIFNLNRVNDAIENAGPLAGLYSGLLHSKTEDNLVLSCDVPLINSTVLNIIADNLEDEFDVVQVESKGKSMPIIAAYKKRCMSKCLALLDDGERRLRNAVKQFKTKTIPLESDLHYCTMNINTPNELETIKIINV
ncbi:molybdenum cofactor guanylyltransferase [Flavobacteriaceae bacterium AU392]|nr:molybdenum cofactor guanylyltransferase [Flavobacteriaceae bacterium]RKM84186.1 molybdenum cofactor guanylyltransferase [Flavobacteriaceae bacterium AU392]